MNAYIKNRHLKLEAAIQSNCFIVSGAHDSLLNGNASIPDTSCIVALLPLQCRLVNVNASIPDTNCIVALLPLPCRLVDRQILWLSRNPLVVLSGAPETMKHFDYL